MYIQVNNTLRKACLTLLALHFFLVAPLKSQHRSLRFQQLTTEDGLAQNMVDCMLQDSQGFLWMGTWNGLCRYDGYTFEVFNSEHTSPNALANNFIYVLLEDTYGNIWIGTQEGLYVYLYDQGQFVRAENLSSEQYSPLQAAVRSLALHQDSTLLVGTDQGLSRFKIQGEDGTIKLEGHLTFGDGDGKLRGSVVNTLLSDSQNNIWVGTDGGIAIIKPGISEMKYITYEPANPQSLSSNHILAICETAQREIWIGTEFGLNRYLDNANHLHAVGFQRFFNVPADPSSLVHNSIMDIIEDDSGNLFIATLGGLSIMNQGEQNFTNHKNEPHAEHSLSNNFVNCLLKDKKGNLWIGTERGGINFYNTNQNTFEHFEFKADNANSLSYSTVNSIYEDSTSLWIGTAGGGLNRYDKSTEKFHQFRRTPEDTDAISSDFVTSMHRDRLGRLWVGSWGGGLNVLTNENSHRPYFLHHLTSNRPGLVSNFISSIAEDQKGNLWIGTLGGLVYYDLEADHFETKFSDQSNPRITGVGCLWVDQDQNIWAGTRNGLFHIRIDQPSGKTDQVSKYAHESANPHSISGNYVISVLQDSKGKMWFGTYGQGINQLKTAGDSLWFEAYTTADGLSNNIIYGIQQDKEQNLWLSTDYGLSRLHPKTKKIRNFYMADGLLNNQYYWSAAYQNENGKLYFGGMSGLDAFYPEDIKEIDESPSLVITDIKLLNESVKPGKQYNGVEVIQESAFKADEIYLSYKEKIFGIEFSSLNYQEPGMIRYAYILEGFDKDWNYVSSDRRYASYTNLKPGDYVFKVKASGSNGEFTADPKSITIHIAPPFWDTPWFRILSMILFLALIFGYIRLRTYTLKRQKIVLERQVKERTERINQQKEALSFQAIQLQNNNQELEEKQKFIEGQNQKLELQNKEILSQRDELIKLNKKLKLVSQLKLSFFTNISHEFRTPLTLIIGPLERLLKEHHLGTEVQRSLGLINRNAQRLLHLINQIMDFRKIEKGRMELKVTQGNLSDFCQNVFRAFEPLSEIKEIRFNYQESELPTEVWFDTQKLENILYNLLSNAFKYTPAKGVVALDVKGLSYQESRLRAEDTLLQEHKTVISIRISDSGIGISEENLPLVFKRFYRIASAEAFKISGSGIGLALTEELIKTHHGEIFVESKPGKGSVFEIQFPCLKGAYETDELTERTQEGLDLHQQIEILKNELLLSEENIINQEAAHEIDKSKATVLVVEDNVDLRKFISLRLSKTYNVLEAGDGEAGIQLAEKFNPDLVISDVMMPKVDGLKLCATLKNNLSTSHIPVILLTAKSTVENQIEGLEIGADDYLPKPFNFEILEARVQNLIDSRKRLRLHFLQSVDFDVKQATSNSKDQNFLEHAIKTVESQMENSDFGVKDFIKCMGISRSLLHKKLASLTNQSATEFINHLRMKKAQKLLRQNEINISEVAYAVGYNDPKYFSRLFSKHYGQSPTEFLKKEMSLD
ncbi:two-component regulator propeller domain-containing protein [Catalinimonas niigatensis]|uniref:two-component regulator propeller domain-containing protein n=1 Tax=Catalinimonas niigatensis TaxID=1397264 RepID=UPI0026666057|nr:hybrid sensor histidine kinase/response regulator transcription factor [Catalinimonas niigatensis]WPP52112.1 two-component regulator propeller domain-containing protein [Catalinimonas niigatensis]